MIIIDVYFNFETSEYVCIVMLVILVCFINEAPHNQHKHRYTLDEDIISTLEWVNPCGTEPSQLYETQLRPINSKCLKPLRDALHNFIIRLNGPKMHAIDTSDISDWFKYNSTYKFLEQINATTESINLPKRHQQTQKYIGAFQYLAVKQSHFGLLYNGGHDVTIEIYQLLILAKNLLCEIETVIMNASQPIPEVFTRKRMDKLITFRNNNRINKFNCDIDELDNKFTKIRFQEFVHNLQRVLNRSRKNE